MWLSPETCEPNIGLAYCKLCPLAHYTMLQSRKLLQTIAPQEHAASSMQAESANHHHHVMMPSAAAAEPRQCAAVTRCPV